MPDRRKVVTTKTLQDMKTSGEKIAMLTCYDYAMARLMEDAAIDVVLVGDSASNVMAGHETTLPITLDQMLYHASSVVRGLSGPLVVVDLPFGSYQGGPQIALNSAIRVMKETGAGAVKLEGGESIATSVKTLIDAGIPVMGHLGLTPQSINKFGTYQVRAKQEEEAERVRKDARLLEELGCFAVVVEKVPATLGAQLAEQLTIPVIGIGAGVHVDGQVLVLHDALGITQDFQPRFVKQYAHLAGLIREAMQSYSREVKSGEFPAKKHSY